MLPFFTYKMLANLHPHQNSQLNSSTPTKLASSYIENSFSYFFAIKPNMYSDEIVND